MFVPFKSGSDVAKGTFTTTPNFQKIELGFRPKFIIACTFPATPGMYYKYDEEVSTTMDMILVYSTTSAHIMNYAIGQYLQILDDGFSIKSYHSLYDGKQAYYIAF